VEFLLTIVAASPSNVTEVIEPRFEPVKVTEVPPAVVPAFIFINEIDGAEELDETG
jgi:hypothetical protein